MLAIFFGLATGILFGVLLQRAEVLRHDRQLGAMRLFDMTILKFMLSAIIVGMVGLGLLTDLGVVSLSVKALSLGAQIVGGSLFGVGWALLGYCPGTAFGALGEGRTDAAFGILGGWLGAAVYAELYPSLKTTVLAWGSFGKVTLDGALGLNHWLVILPMAVIMVLLCRYFEKRGL